MTVLNFSLLGVSVATATHSHTPVQPIACWSLEHVIGCTPSESCAPFTAAVLQTRKSSVRAAHVGSGVLTESTHLDCSNVFKTCWQVNCYFWALLSVFSQTSGLLIYVRCLHAGKCMSVHSHLIWISCALLGDRAICRLEVLWFTCWLPCDGLTSLAVDLTSVDTCNSSWSGITQIVCHLRIGHVSALCLHTGGRKEGTIVTKLPTAIFHGHWMKKEVRKQVLSVTSLTDTIYPKDTLTPPLPKSLYFLLNDAPARKVVPTEIFFPAGFYWGIRCNTKALLNILWKSLYCKMSIIR